MSNHGKNSKGSSQQSHQHGTQADSQNELLGGQLAGQLGGQIQEIQETITSGIKNVSDSAGKVAQGMGLTMGGFGLFLAGAVIGSVATLLLDPKSGSDRRSALKERGAGLAQRSGEFGTKITQGIKDTAQSLAQNFSQSGAGEDMKKRGDEYLQ